MANFVAPALALANLMPRHLNFRRAALVSAVLGFVILPWNLYNSPLVIVYFLGGLGSFLGPLFGIMLGFDAVNNEQSEGTLNRLAAQPIYRDTIINALKSEIRTIQHI